MNSIAALLDWLKAREHEDLILDSFVVMYVAAWVGLGFYFVISVVLT